MTIFPFDLINEVFGHCSKDSLTKCALGNKEFLDIARAHLYYSIHCTERGYLYPSNPQILIHTKYISFEIYSQSYTPFLQTIYQLGCLKGITQRCHASQWRQLVYAGEYFDALLRIVSLPTVQRFRLYLDGEIRDARAAKILAAIMASPKQRDLSTTFCGTNDQFHWQWPCLQNLDTLRIDSEYSTFCPIDYTTLRRLFLTIHLKPSRTMESFGKNSLASESTSLHLTHLALRFMDFEQYFEPGPLDYISMVVDLDKVSSLTSLTLEILVVSAKLDERLNYSCGLIEQVTSRAPLRMIHLIFACYRTRECNFDEVCSSWKRIPQAMKNRFPHCCLLVHFYIMPGPSGGEAVLELPQNLFGVEKIYDHDIGGPFFSGECTDEPEWRW